MDLFGVAGSGVVTAGEQHFTRYVTASDGPGRLPEQAEPASGQGPCGNIDSVTAFNRLRRAARSQRTKIGAVPQELQASGKLPKATG